MDNITHLSLFSGIGGLDLAAEMAGFQTIGQCEWADYPTKVLEKHWPDVPRWRDIRTLTGESFIEKTGRRTVDVISGGFPCQPFSVAGKRRGTEDDRYLWPEMLRVISELRPAWVVGENVAGIVNMALDQVYADLENEGYAVQALIIPACAVDAPHRRDRCAIIANSYRSGIQTQGAKQQTARVAGIREDVDHSYSGGQLYWQREKHTAETGEQTQREPGGCGEVVADADNGGRSLRGNGKLPAAEEAGGSRADHGGREAKYVAGEWWPTEPNVGRVAYGVPHRVDRLKCLGNAVVPQQFYPVFNAIAQIRKMRNVHEKHK